MPPHLSSSRRESNTEYLLLTLLVTGYLLHISGYLLVTLLVTLGHLLVKSGSLLVISEYLLVRLLVVLLVTLARSTLGILWPGASGRVRGLLLGSSVSKDTHCLCL